MTSNKYLVEGGTKKGQVTNQTSIMCQVFIDLEYAGTFLRIQYLHVIFYL